jgi:hypothetical protein
MLSILSLIGLAAALPAAGDGLDVPPRPAILPAQLIDLSAHYNATLTRGWHPETNVAGVEHNSLEELPRGLQLLAGIPFDIRGLIQLDGGSLRGWGGHFPATTQPASNTRTNSTKTRIKRSITSERFFWLFKRKPGSDRISRYLG